MMGDIKITRTDGDIASIEEIPVRVIITNGEDIDDELVLSESINLDDLAPPSLPPMPGCSTSTKSSSSSSGSSSSSSSNGSSSSSSSDESGDETDANDKLGEQDTSASPALNNKTRIKARVEDGSLLPASKHAPTFLSMPIISGKVVAAGKVINDTIRVVPIKENTNNASLTSEGKRGSKNLSNRKELKTKKKEEKMDPTIRFKSAITPNNKCITSTDTPVNGSGNLSHSSNEKENQHGIKILPGTSTSKTKRGGQSQIRKSSRARKSVVIFDESLSELIHQRVVVKKSVNTGDGTSSTKKQNSRQKKIEPALTDLKFEIDGNAPKTYLRSSGKTIDWDDYLNTQNPEHLKWIAPVNKFQNAPMSNIWKDFAKPGTKIEIPNVFVHCNRPVYWIATIKSFAGYKALIQYETFGYEPAMFAWMSFCSVVPKPIGYCNENYIVLFPPYKVAEAVPNFMHLLVSLIHQYRLVTLKNDHIEIVTETIRAQQIYKLHDMVEVMDCSSTGNRRLAKVTGLIGDRVHVTYVKSTSYDEPKDAGYWFNVKSDQINPLGWCQTVGVELTGVPRTLVLSNLDPSKLPSYPDDLYFSKGMVFEVIHPLNLDRIAAAKIERVYKFGYFLAIIACSKPACIQFVFHISSPWVLPCGFCEENGIDLVVPNGESKATFNWDNYCSKNEVVRLDLSSLSPMRSNNPFSTGEKFEAIDLRQPSYCGPVTVIKVAQHLMLLHFDGWPRDSEYARQWIDFKSPEIYPAGWSEMMGHEFQSHPALPKLEDNPICLIP